MATSANNQHTAPDGWTKSSYSGQTGDCVEWRRPQACTEGIEIRDSINPSGPTLTVSPEGWQSFVKFAATFDV